MRLPPDGRLPLVTSGFVTDSSSKPAGRAGLPGPLDQGLGISAGYASPASGARHAGTEGASRENRLADALVAARVGAFVYWIEEDRVEWEPLVYSILGMSPEEDVTRESFANRVHPEDRDRIQKELDDAVREERGYDHRYRVGAEDDVTWVQARAEYREARGRRWLTGVVLDVTREVLAEQRVSALAERLSEQNRQLAQALEALEAAQTELVRAERTAAATRLVAGVAHEMNSPLGALTSALATAERGLERIIGDAQGSAARATRLAIASAGAAADRLSTVVGELLRFARVDRGTVGDLDLREAVERSLRLFHAHFEGLPVELSSPPVAPLRCRATDVQQALTTVLINGAEAVRRGGRQELGLSVEIRQEALGFDVEVRDHGPGIEPEEIPRLLEPAVDARRAGMSMGLPIAAQTCRDHGGALVLRSQLGEGTSVTLKLRPLPT